MASHGNLPPVSSSSLVLVYPTDAERLRIWKGNHYLWGSALPMDEYLDRETRFLSLPLSGNGGMLSWILTDESQEPDNRPILSSFESYRKKALISGSDGAIQEVISYGVASVFTFPECRGKGYARKMMALFAEHLRGIQEKKVGDAAFSVLWSDVGKTFYHTVGWKPFESTWLEFPIANSSINPDGNLQMISYDDLPALTTKDEQLLRKKISEPSSKSRAVVLPDLDTLQWHLLRENFMCQSIFSKTPSIRGAIYTPHNRPDSRIWAIWTRSFYGGKAKPEKNTLYFVRFRIEDETISDEELAKGLKAIVSIAQKEAPEWLCAKAEIWNPGERVKRVAEGIEELGAKFKVREDNNIASLQWFGEGSVDNVEWVANEKFAWC